MAKTPRAPWKRSNPRKRAGKAAKHLSPAQKSAAKARARRAGRRYPNLVDNMRMAAKKTSKKKTSKKKTFKKKTSKSKAKSAKKSAKKSRKRSAKKTAKSSRKGSASAREKDPRGGLTAAGRKAFARKQGAHLRPGVTKPEAEMTPQEMRRKGSWAVRFYGRAKLPPLVDAKGRPTRHALSAHAWGEPVPKTVAAARRIAVKGERLLARYRRTKR
ncbi:DUF6321 domain-containing protein [Bradyrhizobium amphicarpaeae]|uniref:DUF6321 domain-containing protein n=1 Tax=Bradyrhizobium amphicarpaeae TaxID=1404768 RepID=A0A2U8PX74_9BRAD|nr:DUF6321 domain-containing protein [Bradyrhizobium amphicarpaeae]AWM02249.1 hypothetical protein CIT40_20970 [Bradyrhizobium amphicarpaeae]